MLTSLPLTLLSLVLYNVAVFVLPGGAPATLWAEPLFAVPMLSGTLFTATLGDGLVVLGIVLLFFEILKATRTGNASLADHTLSMLTFVGYLVEFLVVPAAAHSVFAILLVLAFVDVVAGFSITIRGARRDVGWGP